MKRKVSKIDYSKAMLPRYRRQQFLDCFKMNYVVLLKCGLMLLLFFLPMIVYSVFADFYYVSLIEHIEGDAETTKLWFHYFFNIGLILFSFVALIGVSGVVRILRNLIWGEGIFFKDDFAQGVRQNALKNIVFALVFSLFYAGAYFIYSIFPETIVAYIPLLFFALVFIPVYFWITFLNNTYDSNIGTLIRNGLYFYIKTIGWSILGGVMTLLPIPLIFIDLNFVWLKYIILLVFIIFIYPIIFLVMTLYTTNKFDDAINKDNYKEYYHRGLNAD